MEAVQGLECRTHRCAAPPDFGDGARDQKLRAFGSRRGAAMGAAPEMRLADGGWIPVSCRLPKAPTAHDIGSVAVVRRREAGIHPPSARDIQARPRNLNADVLWLSGFYSAMKNALDTGLETSCSSYAVVSVV